VRIRTLLVFILLVVLLTIAPAAQAATQVFLWPSQFSYATPSGRSAGMPPASACRSDPGSVRPNRADGCSTDRSRT